MNQHLIGLDEKTLAALEKLGVNGQETLERMFLAFRAEPLAYLITALMAAVLCAFGGIRSAKAYVAHYDPGLKTVPDQYEPLQLLSFIFFTAAGFACLVAIIYLGRVMAADAYSYRQILKMVGQ